MASLHLVRRAHYFVSKSVLEPGRHIKLKAKVRPTALFFLPSRKCLIYTTLSECLPQAL